MDPVNTWSISALLERCLGRRDIPSSSELEYILDEGIRTLQTEDPKIRPTARGGEPGGLVRLNDAGYCVIVPDLHGRADFFYSVMMWNGYSGATVLDDMAEGKASVICVGDAFHSEIRGRERWKRAMKEWINGYKIHKNMDLEMLENLQLLEMICKIKSFVPKQFHFIKGNHDNIANEKKEGNYPFRKYAYEGEMVKQWMLAFPGNNVFDKIYRWEKLLPVAAEGDDFLVTHAEPGRIFTRDEIINAYYYSDVIYKLTWTDNEQAEPGSVSGTLENFGKMEKCAKIFGGHRPVRDSYSLRQNGRYVQINTPQAWTIAVFSSMRRFEPDNNIIRIDRGNRE